MLLLLALLLSLALPPTAPCAMCSAEGAGSEPKAVHSAKQYSGKTWYFCQESCEQRFMSNPGAFVKPLGDFGAVPAFSLVDAEGKTRTNSDYKGKTLVLHLWATWCPACVGEMPQFVELQKKHPEIAILGLSKDKDAAKHKQFLETKGVNFPSAIVPKPYLEDLVKAVGPISAIPTTIVVNKQGKIVYRKVGLLDADFAKALK